MFRSQLFLLLSTAFFVQSISAKVALGGACSQDDNRLDSATGAFVTDCDSATYCSDDGVCVAKTCRKDEYPLGYSGVSFADLPPLCPTGQFCPDEGSGCLDQIAVGGGCQLDRDDECQPPTDYLELAGALNVNGSTCLNYICYYANATLGTTCVFENKAYLAYTSTGSSYAYVWSRDNCANGLYCDGSSALCVKKYAKGTACDANKECLSYYCVDGYCHAAAGDPKHPGDWVYAIVAICIFGLMAGVMVGLWIFHKKSRQQRRIELDQYESEQAAYRQALLSLSNARQSIMALPKDTPEYIARQSLYSMDNGYPAQSSALMNDSPPPSRRGSSTQHGSWGEDRAGEEDVLIIPSRR